ncbi:Hypothetical_protein [Hexamita inflata]|uniref:Hypothetical_protein n=1 Tax=Hexamita inflata TaxID=28002 RepID=A0ABP1HGW9_9EUKA
MVGNSQDGSSVQKRLCVFSPIAYTLPSASKQSIPFVRTDIWIILDALKGSQMIVQSFKYSSMLQQEISHEPRAQRLLDVTTKSTPFKQVTSLSFSSKSTINNAFSLL